MNTINWTSVLYVLFVFSSADRTPTLHRTRSPKAVGCVLIRPLSLRSWLTRWTWWWASLLLCTARTARRLQTARGAGSSLLGTVRWSARCRWTQRSFFFFCLTGREEMDWVEIAQRKRKLQKNGRCLQMWLDCSATKWIDLGGVWCLCWPDVDRPVSVQRVFKAAQPVEENCFTLKARMSGKVKMKIKLEDSIHPVESMDELTNNTLITCYPDAHCTFTGIIQLFFIGGTDVAFILVWFVSWNKGYRVAVL